MIKIKQLLVLLILLSGFSLRAQSLEWKHEIKFDTINYPGVRHVFVQLCIKDIDSVIVTGSATVLQANIKGIGKCLYKQNFNDTMLVRVEVVNKGPEAFEELDLYFSKMTDDLYNKLNIDGCITKVAFIVRNGVPIHAILTSDKKHKRNSLVLLPVKLSRAASESSYSGHFME